MEITQEQREWAEESKEKAAEIRKVGITAEQDRLATWAAGAIQTSNPELWKEVKALGIKN